jgi:hypothetical protein
MFENLPILVTLVSIGLSKPQNVIAFKTNGSAEKLLFRKKTKN